MKILFLVWESLGGKNMLEALEKIGYEVELFDFSANTDKRQKLTDELTLKIISSGYKYVFSFNYFSNVAIACKACKVTYVSWVYDSPCLELYSSTIKFETNRVFVFDSFECQKMNSLGVSTVEYLPLASAAKSYDKAIKSAVDCEKYRCDIAFVGAIKTESDKEKFHRFDKLDQYTKGYLDGVIQAQKHVYGYNFVESTLTGDIINNLQKVFPISIKDDSIAEPKWIYSNYYINQRITGLERTEIIKMLSEDYNFNLYTLEETPLLPKTHNMGEVNYYTEAPLAFYNAKINLNITTRSIQNGIPLRALDIMGSHGFLLTNYQSDFERFFIPNEDFVYYKSYDDLASKVDYYLNHEEERKAIAENGYNKVKKFHSYADRIKVMFD